MLNFFNTVVKQIHKNIKTVKTKGKQIDERLKGVKSFVKKQSQ